MKFATLSRSAFSQPRHPSVRIGPALVAHRAFAPLIGGWGAALGGLAVLVLSAEHAARIAALTNAGVLGGFARPAIAAAAAMMLGTVLYLVARALSRKPSRQIRPVVVARKAAPESCVAPIVEPVAPDDEPERLPPVADEGATQPAPSAAIMKLRQIPKHELSLLQMVERFAAALHEHQASGHAVTAQHGPMRQSEREAILAEALNALSMVTERGFHPGTDAGPQSLPVAASDTERQLRDALARLQSARRVA